MHATLFFRVRRIHADDVEHLVFITVAFKGDIVENGLECCIQVVVSLGYFDATGDSNCDKERLTSRLRQ